MTEQRFWLIARAVLAWCGAALIASGPALAEEPPPPVPPTVVEAAAAAAASVPTPVPTPAVAAGNKAVTLPAEKSADIQTHWTARRDYVRDRDDRRADDEEQRVRALKDELGIENLFSIAAALVRESHDARAAGAPAVAVQRCKLAVEFAPGLPDAHTCLARALLAENVTAIKPAFVQLAAAATAAIRDPRVSRALLANGLAVLFAGLLTAGIAFALALFLRYARLYAHDVHHLFPAGARPWQTRMLAAALLLVPLLLQMGPLPLLFTALLSCALYASTAETAIALALLATLAGAPFAAEEIGKVAAYGGSAVDVWLVEHGEGTGPEIARLRKRAEAGAELPVSFALARKAKRDGDLGAAERHYLEALEVQGATSAGLAAVRNNLGNVYLLEGETQKAIAQYQQAADLHDGLAAAHFNLSRALAMGGVETLEKVQAEQARALQLDRAAVDAFTGGSLQANRKANRFVMDVPLDDAQLSPLFESGERIAEPVSEEVRAQLAHGLPAPLATALPFLVAAAFFALHAARTRLRPSTRCDRCGREVCRRCDPDSRPAEALCAQCVNVFIRRTGVDTAERLGKELAVQRWHRRRHLLARGLAVLSGAGHVLMGYPLRGVFFLVVTGSVLASVLLWSGIAHHPIAVRSGVSWVRVGITAAVLIGTYAFCFRDLLSRQRAEEGA